MTIKKRLVIMTAPTIIIILGLMTLYTQYTTRKVAVELAYTEALSMTADQSSEVMNKFLAAQNYLNALAGEFNDLLSKEETVKDSEILEILHSVETRENTPRFNGLGLLITLEDAKNRSYIKSSSGITENMFTAYFSINAQGKYKYNFIKNFKEEEFFKSCYSTGKPSLTKAYKNSFTNALIVSFSTPIKVREKVVGVLFTDIELEGLSDLVANMTIPYAGGYAFVATYNGLIVAHPNKSNLLKNLYEFDSLDKTKIDEELKKFKPIRESGVKNGNEVITLIYPFKVTDDSIEKPWYFGVVLPKKEVMADANSILYQTILISALGLLCALGIIFMSASTIAKSLQKISHFSSEIAEGKYDTVVSSQGFTSELLALKDSLMTMVKSLLTTMNEATQSKTAAEEGLKKAELSMTEAEEAKNIAEASQRSIIEAAENIENVSSRLSAAAEELSAQIEKSSRSAEQQREQVGKSVSAMEKMNTSILDVAQNASSASIGSIHTKTKAEEGAKIVKNSILAIDEVGTDISILQEEMEGLKEQAESIGKIMTVISDIADQTNLLALNAAIEAARAGEYGRGFAVVADEVRKLAEKTMSATGEVGQAITGIQSRMERSVSALGVTTTNLSKSTELVSTSEESLSSIVEYALISAEQISSIATAVEQQSASCQHINKSLSDINRISGEVATVMNESSQAIMDLSRQAGELEELVVQLRDR